MSGKAVNQIAGKAATHDLKGNLITYEINGRDYTVTYDLDNCVHSVPALRNPISSSGNSLLGMSRQTKAEIIKVKVDNDDVEYRYDAFGRRVIRKEVTTKSTLIWWGNSEKDRKLVGLLDRSEATCPDEGRVNCREAAVNQCAEHKHQAGQIGLAPLIPCQMVGSPPSLQVRMRQGRYSIVFGVEARIGSIIGSFNYVLPVCPTLGTGSWYNLGSISYTSWKGASVSLSGAIVGIHKKVW